MRRRRESAERTRGAIIDAAHRLLRDPAGGALSLDEVARTAGITRATLYNHFGSRRVLLTAVFEDQGRVIGYDRVHAAQQLPDPREALTSVLREIARAWSSDRVALRRSIAIAVGDAEASALVARYEGYRRQEIGLFALRLHDAGVIDRSVPAGEVAIRMGALTSFHFFDVLAHTDSIESATARFSSVVNAALGVTPLT
jgi:AcrR family transcriptional regulator